ncbi:MAG: hypothetical protein IPH08_04385 [Rhodocyclaceae bacterium]|nr:hypothetical protein [Rhodocyclaceae bacterium]
MRLPLVPKLSTKDGSSDSNGRMTNMLVNTTSIGVSHAEIRPALALQETTATPAQGNGIVDFNGTLLSIYGTDLIIVDPPEDVTAFPSVQEIEVPLIYGITAREFSGFSYIYDYEFVGRGMVTLGATQEGYANIKVIGVNYITD